MEPLPAQPQATTLIVSGPAVTGVVLGPAGEPVAGASVTITGPNTQETLTTNTAGQWSPLPLLGGAYEFQASAPGYTAWPAPRQVSLTGTATITLTLAPATNAIASGDFEGDNVWNVWDWAGQINLSIEAFDGQAAARLGDGSGEPTDCPNSQPGQLWSLGQRVTISTGPEPHLSFLFKISPFPTSDSRPPTPGPWLSVFFETDGETHELISPDELLFSPEWTLVHQDLSAWQGKTGTLQFQVVRCAEEPFSVSLDRVSLGSGQ
ncbi:MAG: carboxypeptidase regulatory-like domain-containing protein [Anaerolineales bacterium]|nr:carboxypeptidase regulatory-like domain-containing protein [Anaerolineales bacterium]